MERKQGEESTHCRCTVHFHGMITGAPVIFWAVGEGQTGASRPAQTPGITRRRQLY